MKYFLREVAEQLGFEVNHNNMIICPFHEELEPSCWLKGTIYHCFGCHKTGDAFNFVMDIRDISFEDAKAFLAGELDLTPIESITPELTDRKEKRTQKIKWIKEVYKNHYSIEQEPSIKEYFNSKHVNYYPEMKCLIYRHGLVDFIGIPMPFPENIIGLECRSIEGHKRICLGVKTLWLLRRDTSKFLITESIIDALAGDRLLQDKSISLCSLNGTGNINKLNYLFSQYKPSFIIFALDNDSAGREALSKGKILCEQYKIRYNIMGFGEKLKDLHDVLIKKVR
jgi:hypothetical protein